MKRITNEKTNDKPRGKLKKPELLCPASSLEVLKCAVRYGADAVYIGGESYGLRAKAKNFSPEEMASYDFFMEHPEEFFAFYRERIVQERKGNHEIEES